MRTSKSKILVLGFVAGAVLFAAPATPRAARYMVVLKEPAAAERYPGRIEKTRAVSATYRQHLRDVQTGMRTKIEGLHMRVTGGVQHIANALFVVATPAQAAGLRNMPGVKAVMRFRTYHKVDQLSLSNVQSAWNSSAIGGESNAGTNIAIGIIDTGIDQNNPAFQDSSLALPSGYPLCYVQSDCDNFTNNKVIVARSYVPDIVYADDPNGTSDLAQYSRPDDLSARDLDGHGTAVAAVAAGVATTFNGTTVTGVAPKAYLGNYKIFGSDDANPNGSGNIVQAMEDAVTDGMNIVNLSLGGAPYGGPTDEGCSSSVAPPSSPIPVAADACDPLAYAVESAMENALVVVVVAAGNESDTGYQYNLGNGAPTFGTTGSPADAPSAIAVGAIQNNVTYVQSVQYNGNSIDATQSIEGVQVVASFTEPIVDVNNAGDSSEGGLLCNGLSGTPLANAFALVQRGSCDFSTKVSNAQNAGALGVIFVDNGSGISNWTAGPNAGIPSFLVGQSDGANLTAYVDGTSGAQATMDPDPFQQLTQSGGSITSFSSRGPATGTNGLKPDLSAAGTDFLLPTQSFDPYGELFGINQYTTAAGTSFATPMVSGAAALVLQAFPGVLQPLQVKSALANTATLSGLTSVSGSGSPSLDEVGSGLLQVQNAVAAAVQIVPSSVSFGVLSGSLPAAQTLSIANSGSSAVTLQISVSQPSGLSGTQVQVNNATSTSAQVLSGATATFNVSLAGGVPGPGRYEGLITATGGPVNLVVPYMFLVSDNTPYDLIPLNSTPPGALGFDGPVGAQIPCVDQANCVSDYGTLGIRVVDQYGAPVQNYPVTWTTTMGNGSVEQGAQYTSTVTDVNGLAFATVILDTNPGPQEFTATVNNMSFPFDGNARVVPIIGNGGVVDAASFTGGRAVAPGAFIAIFGTNMSDFTDLAFSNCPVCNVLSQALPMGVDGVSVSFDVPSANPPISVPGRINYVSAGQLNVVVPWELQGQTSAIMKVIVNYTYSAEYNLSLASTSPGFYILDPSTQLVAALDQNNAVVTSSNAVARGQIVQLYMNGMGPVNNQPADGLGVSGASSTTTSQPVITIGGQQSSFIEYSGLAPGYVGLYQINAQVPSGIGTGLQPITCSIGGVSCASAMLNVK